MDTKRKSFSKAVWAEKGRKAGFAAGKAALAAVAHPNVFDAEAAFAALCETVMHSAPKAAVGVTAGAAKKHE